ncbi:MAG: GNAT family N-acetyltransferase [Alphaproteobacteria bacterium]
MSWTRTQPLALDPSAAAGVPGRGAAGAASAEGARVERGAAIETRRLKMRPVDAALARALHEDRAGAARLGGAILHRDFPDEDLSAMLATHAEELAAAPQWRPWGLWLVTYKPERMVVGAMGFQGPPDATGVVAIGYAIVAAHRRRGLATEGAAALIDWAFGDGGVGCVQATCGADNMASIKLLSKLGFTLQGAPAPSETLRWLVTHSEWVRRRTV